MNKNFITIGFMSSRLDKKMQVLTAEAFDSLINSEKVRQTMARIEAEPDPEKKAELKQQLPVVLFACQMTESGERPSAKNNLGKESGFCLHDWDHMPVAPGMFYMDKIAGREQELGIVLAHITPRGEGLRLVTLMKAGETIVQCQAQMAAKFGMEQYADSKIKDITRLSYLPSIDYMLHVDKAGLFEQPCKELTERNVQSCKELTSQNATPDVVVDEAPEQGVTPEPQQLNIADSFYYEGIKFSTIIEALLKRIATQGTPQAGERNNDLYILVRELRHICNYNFNQVYMLVAPYFKSLPDAEVRRTISSAIATNGRTITPVMRGVINELKNENVDVDVETEAQQLPKLPKLSPVEEMILSHYPKYLRSQAFMAMLPIWGLYGTHIRFMYLDGRVNSMSFMTAVVGKSGSGKAFAAHLFDQMTKRFQAEDAQERQKADQYLAMCNKAADASEKPDDPRPRVRMFGDDITTSQFLEYLDNLGGEHAIQFTEEVARLQKSKRTVYGDNDDLYCKAFDNAIGGKESKSKLTRNIRIPIYLNTLFCGTPGAMHQFYNNPAGGLNNRILFAYMPNVRIKGFPRYEAFNAEEQAQFDQVTDQLWQAGKDQPMVKLEWLEKCIMMLKTKWDKEDEENPDEVWYDLGKRALVVAMRVGVLQWFLRGCPDDEKQQREICKVVKWTAEAMRQNVYAFSGKDYEKINETDNAMQQQATRKGKNKKLLSVLPDEFTTQDLISLRAQNGDSTNVAMVICRWTVDGLIRKVGEGRYQKVPQLVA